MKRLIFALALVLATLSVYAGKASAVNYKMAPSERHYEVEDENIAISYEIYNNYLNGDKKFGPNPYLRVKFCNKTDAVINIDLGASSLLVGSNASPLSADRQVIRLDPQGTLTVDDIQIFTPGCEEAMSGLICFKEVGKGKKKAQWCYASKADNLNKDETVEFDEASTPFTIGAEVIYSTATGSQSSKAMRAEYYVERMIGTSTGTSSWSSPIPLPSGFNALKGAADAVSSGMSSLIGTRATDKDRNVITIQLWYK